MSIELINILDTEVKPRKRRCRDCMKHSTVDCEGFKLLIELNDRAYRCKAYTRKRWKFWRSK